MVNTECVSRPRSGTPFRTPGHESPPSPSLPRCRTVAHHENRSHFYNGLPPPSPSTPSLVRSATSRRSSVSRSAARTWRPTSPVAVTATAPRPRWASCAPIPSPPGSRRSGRTVSSSLILGLGSGAAAVLTAGAFASASWNTVVLCAAVAGIGLAVCWATSPALDALAFGREIAASLGVAPGRTRLLLLGVPAFAVIIRKRSTRS
ncbi:iron chelate uptake ABC transporter family permease subunit [Streptosporangium sp. NPDC006930]|uniref:iron chelate uptake ABC transporter family permease subunit n=1 Tax=unclassified Streptosporangium TaxID=2632669 RepID=UPI003437C05B